jgi:hypothetical protein
MKHLLKIVLLMALCVTMLASCDLASVFPFLSQEEETTTASEETTTTAPDPEQPGDEKPGDEKPGDEQPGGEELPEPILVIVNANASSNYKIIIGDGVESDLWSGFIADVQKKTGMTAKGNRFSQYKEASRPKDDQEITLNVKKGEGREAVADVFKNHDLTQWSVQLVGNRVVINAFSETGMKEALKQLKEYMEKEAK